MGVLTMAELQWVIEVRCINALLAQIKVGERGEYFIVDIPGKDFFPSELDKLIRAFEIASEINEKNRYAHKASRVEGTIFKLSECIEITDKRDIVTVNILSSGEIVNINVLEPLLAPSEARRLLEDLKVVRQKMGELKMELENQTQGV